MIEEQGSTEAVAIWEWSERVVSSRLLYPEARAALARAGRAGRIHLRSSRDLLEELWRDVDCVEVTPEVAERAGELAEALDLRGYDAVHLASVVEVADAETMLVAADSELTRAAHELGLSVASLPL